MKISIIVPIFNEEKTIKSVVIKLKEVNLPCQKEIILVDDGSTDSTPEQLRKITQGKSIYKLVTHDKNRGKGQAIKTGIAIASGEFILIQDADLEYNPDEIPLLLNVLLTKINENKYVKIAIYGSRFLTKTAQIPFLYLYGNKFLTQITNILYNVHLTDMETGYKLIPASIIKNIKIQSAHFDFEPEITAKLLRKNFKIIEVPISYKGRTHGAGKKLTPMDAFEAVRALLYYRFSSPEYR